MPVINKKNMFVQVVTKIDPITKYGTSTLLSVKKFRDIRELFPVNQDLIKHFTIQKNAKVKDFQPFDILVQKDKLDDLIVQIKHKLGMKRYFLDFIPIVYDSNSKIIIRIKEDKISENKSNS